MNFSDLKVIELAGVLAGPSVGMFFAELGSEVIKIENPNTNGDITRGWKIASEEKETNVSAYFSSANYHKKYTFIDYTNKQGYNELLELIKKADIVICNFKYGYDVKFKLDFDTLKKVNPNLIYGSIEGFKDIPQRTAFDVVLQAETGYLSMNGTPDSGVVKLPVAFIDLFAAHQLKEGILIALLKQQTIKKAYKVTTNLQESALASLANQATNFLMNGHIPQPLGTLHPNIAPYGEVFATKDDKKIVLAIGNDKQFISFCKLINSEELSVNPLFETNNKRVENRSILFDLLKNAVIKFTRNFLLKESIVLNIPLGAIRNMAEVFENDVAKAMVLNETIENRETKRMKTVAFKITEA